jgi:hypothetical protein
MGKHADACGGLVHLALAAIEIKWPTADELFDFLRAADEEARPGELITLADVLEGLMALRKRGAVVVSTKGLSTHYMLMDQSTRHRLMFEKKEEPNG